MVAWSSSNSFSWWFRLCSTVRSPDELYAYLDDSVQFRACLRTPISNMFLFVLSDTYWYIDDVHAFVVFEMFIGARV